MHPSPSGRARIRSDAHRSSRTVISPGPWATTREDIRKSGARKARAISPPNGGSRANKTRHAASVRAPANHRPTFHRQPEVSTGINGIAWESEGKTLLHGAEAW